MQQFVLSICVFMAWYTYIYFLLRLLIKFVGNTSSKSASNEPVWRGYLYVCLLSIFAVLQTLLLTQYFHRMHKNGLRVRTALISVIYKKVILIVYHIITLFGVKHWLKYFDNVAIPLNSSLFSSPFLDVDFILQALRISSRSRRDFTLGEIVNLMAVDTQCFVDLVVSLNMLWAAPLLIALSLYFLWGILGKRTFYSPPRTSNLHKYFCFATFSINWLTLLIFSPSFLNSRISINMKHFLFSFTGSSVLAGLAVMLMLIPVNGLIVSRNKSLQIKQMKYKDNRVKLMNEILSGIKVCVFLTSSHACTHRCNRFLFVFSVCISVKGIEIICLGT